MALMNIIESDTHLKTFFHS